MPFRWPGSYSHFPSGSSAFGFWSALGRGRKRKKEFGALPRPGFDPDPAVVAFDHFGANRKTDACPRNVRSVKPLKDTKNHFVVLKRNAYPIVRDTEHEGPFVRFGSDPLVPRRCCDVLSITRDDPPEDVPGMLDMALDPQGHLLTFSVVLPLTSRSNEAAQTPSWNALFQAAGLDLSRFHSAEPQWIPPHVTADTRAAWSGTYPEAPDIPIHVEAAAFQGKAGLV